MPRPDDAGRRAKKPEPTPRAAKPFKRRSAAVLSVAIGSSGIMSYAYFALASHSLTAKGYGGITLLWSAVFIAVSVLYRPVEQLLSRTIADRDARAQHGREHLGVAAMIQLALSLLFLVVALAIRGFLEKRLFEGSETLYWIFVVAVIAYAASYFARGFLAGHRLFEFYGGLLLLESLSRLSFSLVVVLGIAPGERAVALGVCFAPIVSLTILPVVFALRARSRVDARLEPGFAEPGDAADLGQMPAFTLSRGSGFAASVLLVMLAEQTFLNAGPVLVELTQSKGGTVLAGLTFNVLLIARAPLQLFQAVQTSILPHLTRLRAHGAADEFHRSIAITIAGIFVFSAGVAGVMLVAGPRLMHIVFGGDHHYGRVGLVVIALGMGLYLSAATLNQAALAHGRARQASMCWIAAAAAFVGFLVVPELGNRVLQVEVGYAAGAALLFTLLYILYRRP